MAEEKKDTDQKKTTAEKNAGGSPAKKAPAKKPAAKKPAAKSGGGQRARKSTAKPKETATRKSGGAAEADARARDSATRKTESGDTEAAKASTAKKPAARKAPAKKAPARAKSESKPKAETKPKPKAKQEAPERPVVNARARFVRVAPRKARLIADQVRGLPLEDALPLLRFSTRSAARDIRKLLESAAANAEANHDLVADDLLIKDIHVDEGPTLRRFRPRALGRATRINKRTSHIVVALTPED
jgi:ribosomal protein L22